MCAYVCCVCVCYDDRSCSCSCVCAVVLVLAMVLCECVVVIARGVGTVRVIVRVCALVVSVIVVLVLGRDRYIMVVRVRVLVALFPLLRLSQKMDRPKVTYEMFHFKKEKEPAAPAGRRGGSNESPHDFNEQKQCPESQPLKVFTMLTNKKHFLNRSL